MTDHYDILGIPRNATKEDIEAAWRNAVKEWHPDRNRSTEAKIRLQEINTARNVLLNDRARREYDRKAGYIKPEPVTRKMERPVRSRTAEEPSQSKQPGKYRQPGFATREGRRSSEDEENGQGEGQGNEWWTRFAAAAKRNAEAVKNEALRAAAEEDRKNVANIAERRPKLTRYVLIPLGVAAILLAAVITVILV